MLRAFRILECDPRIAISLVEIRLALAGLTLGSGGLGLESTQLHLWSTQSPLGVAQSPEIDFFLLKRTKLGYYSRTRP